MNTAAPNVNVSPSPQNQASLKAKLEVLGKPVFDDELGRLRRVGFAHEQRDKGKRHGYNFLEAGREIQNQWPDHGSLREDRAVSKTSSLLVCCLVAALGCISCGEARHRVSQFSEQDITKERLQQYEKLMHLTFPESTRALNSAYESGGPDDAVFLKVEMEKQDAEAFLKNSPFANANLRSDERYIHNRRDLPWWNPDGAQTYKAGKVILPSNGALYMLVDFDDYEKAVVYLTWGEL